MAEHQSLRARWRSRILLSAVAVAVAAPIVLWTVADLDPQPPGQVAAGSERRTVPRDDGRLWHVVAFQPGTNVELTTPLRHRGFAPIEVVAVPQLRRGVPAGHCGWWPENAELEGTPLGPGTPVRVGRGEIPTLVLTGHLHGEPGCLPDAGAGWQERIRLDTRVLGLVRTVTVRLPSVVAWASDPDAIAARFAFSPVAPRVGTAP